MTEQLELFATGDLQPIKKWLHVWDEAKRAAFRKKKSRPTIKRTGQKPEFHGQKA